MAIQQLQDIIDRASIDDSEKQELRRIAEYGLSSSEQEKLAEQMRDDPQLLYDLNNIFRKKKEHMDDPEKFDEVLEEEEKLLERLK